MFVNNYYLILFLFGLAIGSFFNVLACRYDPEKNVFHLKHLRGRSRCPQCGKTLRWFELVPLVSFIIQRGTCRSCKARISIQYPLVELAAGTLTAAVPWFLIRFYGPFPLLMERGLIPWLFVVAALFTCAFLVLLLIAVIDIRCFIIPDELNIILGIAGAAIAIALFMGGPPFPLRGSFLKHYSLLFFPVQNPIVSRLIGAFAGALFFGAFAVASKGTGMGFGDVKLAFASGLVLGWPDIALASLAAFVLGGVWGTVSLTLKKKTMKDRLPFAPFFVLGIALTVFFGAEIVRGYFALFQA